MLIQVLKEDFEKAVRGSPCECVVARALKRMGHEKVDVDPLDDHVSIVVDGHPYAGPAWVSKKLSRWDDGESIRPFEFSVESTYEASADETDDENSID